MFIFVFYSRHRAEAEETSSGPVPVSRDKKRLSGSHIGSSKSQGAGPHQTIEPTTPQKRPADGPASSDVCWSCTYQLLKSLCVIHKVIAVQ